VGVIEKAKVTLARSASKGICKRLQANERAQVEIPFRSTRSRFVLVFVKKTVLVQIHDSRVGLVC